MAGEPLHTSLTPPLFPHLLPHLLPLLLLLLLRLQCRKHTANRADKGQGVESSEGFGVLSPVDVDRGALLACVYTHTQITVADWPWASGSHTLQSPLCSTV